ncbi:MAG TPA: hypothetical protein DDY31_17250 [Lachnospiraceae bacterium]|nr:hypothetical protein [Lachnospiraceae bacterium]
MNKRTYESDDAIFITVDTAARITSLGKNTVRKLAEESRSGRKFGRAYRIHRQAFLSYLNSLEA